MPDGGRLTIESVVAEAALTAQGGALRPYVCLRVGDTGAGMSEEIMQRVFEPFFSTKGEGKGTGLGLSMVYGFARQAGGDVRIESAPGEGTVVSLYFPPAVPHSDKRDQRQR